MPDQLIAVNNTSKSPTSSLPPLIDSALGSSFDHNDHAEDLDFPFSEPSNASSSRGNLLVYAEMLNQLPTVVPYVSHFATSSAENGPKAFDYNSSHYHGNITRTVDDQFWMSQKATSAGVITRLAAPVGPESLVPAAQGLKMIQDKREQLFHCQLRVESLEKQLADERRIISKEVERALSLVDSQQVPDASLRSFSVRNLLRMRASLNKLKSTEEQLEAQQSLLTTAQSKFKRVIDNFYASITSGALMDESLASDDDPIAQTLEAETAQLMRSNASTGESGTTSSSETKPETVPDDYAESNVERKRPELEIGQVDLTNAPYASQDDAATTEIAQLQVDRDLSNKTKPRKARLRHPELDFCGCLFPASVLTSYIKSAEQCDLLRANRKLKNVRGRDLGPEIAIDHIMKNVDNSSRATSPSIPIRRTILQKFNDAKVKSVYTSDFISLWGANMSQNSWTDLLRIVLFDKPEEGNRKPLSILHLDATALTGYLRHLDIPSIQTTFDKPSSTVAVARHSSRTPSLLVDDYSMQVNLEDLREDPDKPRLRDRNLLSLSLSHISSDPKEPPIPRHANDVELLGASHPNTPVEKRNLESNSTPIIGHFDTVEKPNSPEPSKPEQEVFLNTTSSVVPEDFEPVSAVNPLDAHRDMLNDGSASASETSTEMKQFSRYDMRHTEEQNDQDGALVFSDPEKSLSTETFEIVGLPSVQETNEQKQNIETTPKQLQLSNTAQSPSTLPEIELPHRSEQANVLRTDDDVPDFPIDLSPP